MGIQAASKIWAQVEQLTSTSDAVEVLPATWQQLVATGREETRSTGTKVQSGTV